MNWRCINRDDAEARFEHFVFVSETRSVAIADHSMRDMSDPSSTDDGLIERATGRKVFPDSVTLAEGEGQCLVLECRRIAPGLDAAQQDEPASSSLRP